MNFGLTRYHIDLAGEEEAAFDGDGGNVEVAVVEDDTGGGKVDAVVGTTGNADDADVDVTVDVDLVCVTITREIIVQHD